MSYQFTSANGGNSFTFVSFGFAAPPPPQTCHACDRPHEFRTNDDGRLWCKPCLDAEQRRRVVEHAPEWIEAVFHAVTPENRGRAYKALAALFHPDQGGDEALMVVLNRVREKFR